jgi:TM2 domain-containing membrane protein YozV/predicted nucleic acid-binding Zn ribbon protein
MAKFCTGCGMPVEETAQFCSTCGARLSDAGSAGMRGSAGVHEEKNPNLALLCSFFIPGLGQVYDGNTARGIGIFIGTAIGFFIFFVPGLIVWIYGMYDARSTAKRMNRGEIPFRPTKTAHMILFFILAALIIAVITFMILMAALAMFNSMIPNYSMLPYR